MFFSAAAVVRVPGRVRPGTRSLCHPAPSPVNINGSPRSTCATAGRFPVRLGGRREHPKRGARRSVARAQLRREIDEAAVTTEITTIAVK
jgi:hypothetical protein